jgi:hypothetical protein
MVVHSGSENCRPLEVQDNARCSPELDRTFGTEAPIYGFASYIYFHLHLRKRPDRLDFRFRAN